MIKVGYLPTSVYNMRGDWMMADTRGGVDQNLLELPYKRIEAHVSFGQRYARSCPGSYFYSIKDYIFAVLAFLAQLVEQLIRNEQVAGSSPVEGSKV